MFDRRFNSLAPDRPAAVVVVLAERQPGLMMAAVWEADEDGCPVGDFLGWADDLTNGYKLDDDFGVTSWWTRKED